MDSIIPNHGTVGNSVSFVRWHCLENGEKVGREIFITTEGDGQTGLGVTVLLLLLSSLLLHF